MLISSCDLKTEQSIATNVNRQGINYHTISREREWIFTATPMVVHGDVPFHLLRNPIEVSTPFTQLTQHQCRIVGNLNPGLVALCIGYQIGDHYLIIEYALFNHLMKIYSRLVQL
jgi:hypothetical protein